mmetsp:Transcript_10355/g.17382  ORF Transcript_10355/g.17382 Transcript_10355/m.17382 type:complete len:107 (-) Transcript_10355:241-561(-)
MTQMPKKAIQGTPWYNLLSNTNYTDGFFYIGAHIGEREKLINDGDDSQGNNCEQSDLVIVLLNLAAIPDEVVQQFQFKDGFQPEFLAMMKAYKEKFERKYQIKWEY